MKCDESSEIEQPVVVGPHDVRHPIALGLAAARANLLPGVLLWAFGSVIVGSYFLWPAARPIYDQVEAWRHTLGLVYPLLSTALFAGLIPFFMQALQRGGLRNWSTPYLVFMLIFWGLKGLEIELLYLAQAWMFGEGRDLTTLVTKTAFDQFVYVSLWGGPTMVLGMLFAHAGFSFRHLRGHLRRGWYVRIILPVVISNWAVWIPAVMLIYMLPTVLQLPVQNVILCLWVLMVMFMTGQQHQADATDRTTARG